MTSILSTGLSNYDFVQQVIYQQEKVLLPLYPDNDKYKEVIVEGNFVLQEFQKEEDWNFLREKACFGLSSGQTFTWNKKDIVRDDDGITNKYYASDTFAKYYKPCTIYGDAIALYAWDHSDSFAPSDNTTEDEWSDYIYPDDVIFVPIVSGGMATHPNTKQRDYWLQTNEPDNRLGAMLQGDKIRFSRPLLPWEKDRIIIMDVQKRILPLYICEQLGRPIGADATPEDRLAEAKKAIQLTEIPDPNYIVMKTAYYHSLGSPMASGRQADLSDTAQKLLSAMRENNSSATAPDYLDWAVSGYIPYP